MHKDQYLFKSTRPHYRAPTFSWASVDSSNGITYGETTDKGLLIKVKDYSLAYRTNDRFGLVTGGYISLSGMLKKAKLEGSREHSSTAYSWQIVKYDKPYGRKHFNLALDSCFDDTNFWPIFGPRGQIYCLIAARGIGTKYLICLLLQLKDRATGTYIRVGWTKISQYDQDSQKLIVEPTGEEAGMPCVSWDAEAGERGEHTIIVV